MSISSCEKNEPYLGYKKAAAEFLAAVSSVTAYHPFRSIGQQIFQGHSGKFYSKGALSRIYLGCTFSPSIIFNGNNRRIDERHFLQKK